MKKASNSPPVIVSACLVGLKTRYNGGHALSEEVMGYIKGRHFIPICPEQLGGLPTPRKRAEIGSGTGDDVLNKGSKVFDETGEDITEFFLRGAECALMICKLAGAKEAYLKDKSPCCGVNLICRQNEPISGYGVAAALLKRHGISVRGF